MPVLDDQPSLSDREKRPAVQAPVSTYAVERLVAAIRPFTHRIDELRVDLALLGPRLDALSDQFRAIVDLDHERPSAALGELAEQAHHVVSVQEPARLYPKAFPSELVDH